MALECGGRWSGLSVSFILATFTDEAFWWGRPALARRRTTASFLRRCDGRHRVFSNSNPGGNRLRVTSERCWHRANRTSAFKNADGDRSDRMRTTDPLFINREKYNSDNIQPIREPIENLENYTHMHLSMNRSPRLIFLKMSPNFSTLLEWTRLSRLFEFSPRRLIGRHYFGETINKF